MNNTLFARALALLAVVGISVSGCGDGGAKAETVAFHAAYETATEQELRILGGRSASKCKADADEASDTVKVGVTCANAGRRSNVCLPSKPCAGEDMAVLRLDKPLGRRNLVDATRGKRVLVCRSPEIPAVNAAGCTGAATGDPMPATSEP